MTSACMARSSAAISSSGAERAAWMFQVATRSAVRSLAGDDEPEHATRREWLSTSEVGAVGRPRGGEAWTVGEAFEPARVEAAARLTSAATRTGRLTHGGRTGFAYETMLDDGKSRRYQPPSVPDVRRWLTESSRITYVVLTTRCPRIRIVMMPDILGSSQGSGPAR